MANITVSVRINDKVKEKSQKMFESLGLDLSTAINIFLHNSLMGGGLPFKVAFDVSDFDDRFSENFKEELRHQARKSFAEMKNSDVKLMETEGEIHEALKKA